MQAADEASEEFQYMHEMMQNSGDLSSNNSEILIVDDEMLNIEVITFLLVSNKISSSCALSGQEALEKVEQRAELV